MRKDGETSHKFFCVGKSYEPKVVFYYNIVFFSNNIIELTFQQLCFNTRARMVTAALHLDSQHVAGQTLFAMCCARAVLACWPNCVSALSHHSIISEIEAAHLKSENLQNICSTTIIWEKIPERTSDPHSIFSPFYS